MQNFETGRQIRRSGAKPPVGLGQPLLWVAVQSSSGLGCTGAVTEAKQFCLSNNSASELQARLERPSDPQTKGRWLSSTESVYYSSTCWNKSQPSSYSITEVHALATCKRSSERSILNYSDHIAHLWTKQCKA